MTVVCFHCGAHYDQPAWLSLALLDRVDSGEVGWAAGASGPPRWIELRLCNSCEHAIAAPAEERANDEMLSTDAAARYCGFKSISGLRQAARRGDVRPWTSSGLKLFWRRSDLDRFRSTSFARTRRHR
jgi:hypothetical protein